MKKFILISILVISPMLFGQSGSNQLDQQRILEIKELLDIIRQGGDTSYISEVIDELEELSQVYNIDLAEFGLGRGFIPYWRKKNFVSPENDLKTLCQRKSTIFKQKIFNGFRPQNKKYMVETLGDFELSIVSEKFVQKLFKLLHYKKYIPYHFINNGCESRAHEMAMIMDELCINSGKAFLTGDSIQQKEDDTEFTWSYHVAPIVFVKINGDTIPYIIDPSVFNKAVPLTRWADTLSNRLEGDYELRITNKYVFYPTKIDLGLNDYEQFSLHATKTNLLKYSLQGIVPWAVRRKIYIAKRNARRQFRIIKKYLENKIASIEI